MEGDRDPRYEEARAANAARGLKSTMMDTPLDVGSLIQRAEALFPNREIVGRLAPGRIERTTYAEVIGRARRIASALSDLGLRPGDRVATLMWNNATHLAVFYALPAIGAVLHALNPRLSPADIASTVADSGDSLLVVDEDLVPLWDRIETFVRIPRVIVNSGTATTVDSPRMRLADLLAAEPLASWFRIPDENAPLAICYTSGTTGRPKGVVYSHRSTILHALALCLPDAQCLSGRDAIFTLTPLFHVNAWGTPYAAAMAGAKQVLPGARISSAEILDLTAQERVTRLLGVPTFFAGVLDELEKQPDKWNFARGLRVEAGGAMPSRDMFCRFDKFGIRLSTGWGMTESSPVAFQGWMKPDFDQRNDAERMEVRLTNGIAQPLVEFRAVGADGAPVPWDGSTCGELQVRGPWITRSYVGHPEPIAATTDDGWLRTGDVAVIRPDGYMRLVDRMKDLVKSGGEWISSIDMENVLLEHPDIREAAVIAVTDPRWGERPLAVIAMREEGKFDPEKIRSHLLLRYPKWMVPERVVEVHEIPKTAVGKLNKALLRARYGNPRD
jgi:fatty-acyl-CoA synthase